MRAATACLYQLLVPALTGHFGGCHCMAVCSSSWNVDLQALGWDCRNVIARALLSCTMLHLRAITLECFESSVHHHVFHLEPTNLWPLECLQHFLSCILSDCTCCSPAIGQDSPALRLQHAPSVCRTKPSTNPIQTAGHTGAPCSNLQDGGGV